MTAPGALTELLARWREGEEVHSRVIPLVYADLRRLAGALFSKEKRDQTLQPTGLVNEAYIRLVDAGPFENREHFFGAAANAMRQTLVDYARRRNAGKRWGALERVELDERSASVQEECREILAIDQALNRLETLNPRQAEFVKLRYFAGLSLREAADALHVSPSTAKEDWSKARAWLKEQFEV